MSRFKRLTIDDIAEMAGVSRTTASMVLNGHAERYRISMETVERVRAVAKKHNFTPSELARVLRKKCSQSIGLVIPNTSNSNQGFLAQELENFCLAQGYQLLIATSNEDAEREAVSIAQLAARQVDGLIVMPCSSEPERYLPWVERLPLVFIDRYVPESGIPSVVTDARASVVGLLGPVLAKGVDELVFFGGTPGLSPSCERLDGYRQALSEGGLAEQEGWVFERDFRLETGYALMQEWYQRHGRYPQALFTTAITLLEGVLAFIRQHHKMHEAPQYLLTFDDHPLLDCLPIPIDAIDQDCRMLASTSLELVLALIRGDILSERDLRVPARLTHRRLVV
ncbi:substrate-binding domain-containing protein [Chromobacterium phragmitis]|uniref:Transcriptional regulator n=1 Tax=Chromobacterium phragmitis TaxID=2202141 RepID=A0A344UNM8_9NEIS|nr:LacI family DNA-binding transcriptional regulator [Chromobacterium phragmitis]AXE36876.1 transcriptional regulator [Chromobacterium phragmitis]